jgi:apolipoprotein D and lipocalin family protein
MIKSIFALFATFSLVSCSSSKDLPTVSEVDLNRYAGLWYEIARLPNRFEKGLDCITAQYTLLENGKVEVINQGRKVEKDNEKSSIKGSARVPNAAFPGRLKVTFFWPFAGDYYIIALDENYTYALVGDPSRKFLWVLSKNKSLDIEIYDKLINIAANFGFATESIIKVNQDCD